MEEMLQSFQDNLGNISEAIQSLQDQSFSMNIKLKNRKAADKEISEFVNEVSIDPKLMKYDQFLLLTI